VAIRVLLIEDDESIGGGLTRLLTGEGYATTWTRSGRGGLTAAAEDDVDMVLLDLGLPDLDGTEVCRLLRIDHPALPIIVITARGDEVDVVMGLDAGADDYITKPFRLAELLARVRSHARRVDGRRWGERLVAGEIEVDPAARIVTAAGREIALSPKEFELLALLVGEAGRVVTRERILDTVWDENWSGSTKTLDMHIVTLRRKLAAAGVTRAQITTRRGVGYRLDVT
jgi:DNA-binding response OmpR family regulator